MPSDPQCTFRVLVVDVTGTIRAPIAERLLRKELGRRGIPREVIAVDSAGLEAVDGAEIDGAAAGFIFAHGGSVEGFRARSLSSALVRDAAMVVTADAAGKAAVAKRFPSASRRTFTMSEIAHLYRSVVDVAPLAEHPALLDGVRARTPAPESFALPSEWTVGDDVSAVGMRIVTAVEWLAAEWESVAPRVERSAHKAAASVRVDAFGVPLRIECAGDDAAGLSEKVGRVWSRLVVPDNDDEAVQVRIAVARDPDARDQARTDGYQAYDTVPRAMHHLSSTVTVRAIEAQRGKLVLLHAAGVADSSGNVVGFIAPSGTGKTTLARTLGSHYGYVTDETLAVTFDGDVLPYPKPLSVIGEGGGALKEQWSAESLDLRPVAPPLRLRRLVLLDRVEGTGVEPTLEPIPLLHGLAEVAEQVSYLPMLPEKLHTLAHVVEGVGGLSRLTYSDAASLIDLVPALVEAP